MTINNNPTSMQQTNYLNESRQSGDRALQNIAAIRAINGMDPSNLAIADQLRTQANTIDQGVANAYDAIGVLQIADASLRGITETADQLNQLSVQRNNAALNDRQRGMIDTQANALITSINDSFNNAIYNGKNVFQSLDFVVGTGTVENVNANPLNTTNLDVSNQSSITNFIDQVNTLRADIGAGAQAITSNINVSLRNSVSVRAAEGGMLNDDVAQNVTDFNADYLKQNASAFAMAHQTSVLQSKIATLLQ